MKTPQERLKEIKKELRDDGDSISDQEQEVSLAEIKGIEETLEWVRKELDKLIIFDVRDKAEIEELKQKINGKGEKNAI